MFRLYVLPWLVWLFYRVWTATWRMDLRESEGLLRAKAAGDRLIFAHWHGDELCIVPLVTPYRIATMTSTSKDGELMDFVIRRMAGATSRGSSTRGGVGALKGLVRLIQQGYRASMAVDGPKGPLHKVKPGVFELSRLANAKIVPVGAASNRVIVFHKSWNKARLPLPFARVVVAFGEPLVVTRDHSVRSPELAERLRNEISNTCKRADEHLR